MRYRGKLTSLFGIGEVKIELTSSGVDRLLKAEDKYIKNDLNIK